jgi:hypothetical protein
MCVNGKSRAWPDHCEQGMEWTGPETLADVEARFPTGGQLDAWLPGCLAAWLFGCLPAASCSLLSAATCLLTLCYAL